MRLNWFASALMSSCDHLLDEPSVWPRILTRFNGRSLFSIQEIQQIHRLGVNCPQPRIPLAAIQRFHGSGVYALYYKGAFAPYAPVSGTETPVYVGKADPAEDTARNPLEQGDRISRRLKDHLRSISKAQNTLEPKDFDCRFLVVQTGWQGAAEMFLIELFRPIWNNETGICFGLGKHGDSPSTRSNKRSPWDTLHPGREWAWRDSSMVDSRDKESILADLRTHFKISRISQSIDHVFKNFLDELSQ